jgi:hypothetical protein
MTFGWIHVPSIEAAKVLLVLPCNDGAAHGNYFVPLDARKKGWNTWKEADRLLANQRRTGEVFFAAVDSSVLEHSEDTLGALVWETEMYRVRNPTGEDWGEPEWRFYDPAYAEGFEELTSLTESLRTALKRLPTTARRFAILDPIAYFIALVAAIREEGQRAWWSIQGTLDSFTARRALPATKEAVKRYLAEGAFKPGILSYPVEWTQRLESLPDRWRVSH